MMGSRTKSGNVSLRLVGSAACSQSRKGCLGFTLHYHSGSIQYDHGKPETSRSTPLIAMVQPTYLRNGDDLPLIHDLPRFGRVLFQSEMCPRAVIIAQITLQYPPQMSLMENHNMVQTLTTNRADQPLDKRVLPRTPGCG